MPRWDWPSFKDWITEQAPVQVAAGEISEIRSGFELARQQNLAGLDYAVNVAAPLSRESLAGIKDGPTLLYKHTYSQLNYLLDRIALGITLRLQESGHRAVAVPASQIIDWEELKAHVNHRMVAVHLGQGWYGRNNLLVTPAQGAQVRLVTVITDCPVEEPGPWSDRKGESGCGKCMKCVSVCPASAILTGPEDFDRQACFPKVREFEKIRGIGQRICGVCVKACKGPADTEP